MMTKRDVKKALGIDRDSELAKVFGVGRWAIGQWADDKPIPARRQVELQLWYPKLFPQPRKTA